MSKVFYDHLIDLKKTHRFIHEHIENHEERVELWAIVDEIVHYRVIHIVLTHLPNDFHEDFLEKFLEAPYDQTLLLHVNSKTNVDIEEKIREELESLEEEILREILAGA